MNTERALVTTSPALAPWQYEILWWLAVYGPLTAGEIAAEHNRPRSTPAYFKWTSQGAAARLRSLVRLGLIVRRDDAIYDLTDRGAAWLRLDR